MRPSETLLKLAQRHVHDGEIRILRQRDLVHYLETTRSLLTDNALELLAIFHSMQDGHERHLTQIEDGIQSGHRDADGNLLPLLS